MYHCSGIRKSLFMVWFSINGQNIDAKLLFPGIEEPVVCGRVSSTGGKVLRWSQSVLSTISHCSGLKNVYSWFDPVKIAKVLTGIHKKSWFSRFQRAVFNGFHLVNHSIKGIFDVTIAFLQSLTLKMWILIYYIPYFWHHGSTYYALLCWWRPSWKMVPCANCTQFWRCQHAIS